MGITFTADRGSICTLAWERDFPYIASDVYRAIVLHLPKKPILILKGYICQTNSTPFLFPSPPSLLILSHPPLQQTLKQKRPLVLWEKRKMLPKEGNEIVFVSNRFASRYVFSKECFWLFFPSSFIQRGCGRLEPAIKLAKRDPKQELVEARSETWARVPLGRVK